MDPLNPEIFAHVRLVLGFVISLSIARLLTGVSRFIQHPEKLTVYPIHLIWTISMLFMLVHFWWWEFWLTDIKRWTFPIYGFLILFTVTLYLLCSLLYPDNLEEYAGYEDYFYDRKRWFFGLFALTFVFDFADTLLKGDEYLAWFGLEYLIRAPTYIAISIAAMFTENRKFHWTFAILNLVYQVSFATRLFMTLS